MTLTEFVLARLAEEEARARDDENPDQPHGRYCGWALHEGPGASDGCRCGLPTRVLADVEAKRRIVEEFREAEQAAEAHDPDNPTPLYWQEWGTRHGLWSAVEHLAAAWSDHPDYQEEWKP